MVMKLFEKGVRKSSRKLTTKSTSTSKIQRPLETNRHSQLFPKRHSSKQTTEVNDMGVSKCVKGHGVVLEQAATQPNERSKEVRRRWEEDKIPYSSAHVIQHFNHMLTQHELAEICDYKKIYYVGQRAKQLKFSRAEYDNEEKEYVFVERDHVAYRYELIEPVGKGSYGQVFRAYDHKAREDVAVKIIKNKSKFKKQAYIELKILTHIKENEGGSQANIVKTKDMVIFRKHVCLVFELLSENLYDLMVRNNHSGLGFQLIRRFAIQILTTLVFLTKQRIIHCDLKPENILLKEKQKSGIKIIDFGSSCFDTEILYTYIQSRYYRAPQITLAAHYSFEIDIWSTGCILAELHTSLPLFPGEHEKEQMKYMVDTLGPPPASFIESGQRAHLFFDEQHRVRDEIKCQNVVPHFTKPLAERIGDEGFCEFIKAFLVWDPKQRITPIEALSHPWIMSGLPKELADKYKESKEKISREKISREKISREKVLSMKEKNGKLSMKEKNGKLSMKEKNGKLSRETSRNKGVTSGRSSKEKIKRSGMQF